MTRMSAYSVFRPGDESGSARQPIATMSLPTLATMTVATVLMLQSMRVFVSYLVFVIDQSNRTALGSIATGVFLASGLVWVLIRFSSPKLVLIGSAIALALARLTLQYWQLPVARLWLGAIVVIAWGWIAYSLLIENREIAGLGIVIGLAFDLGIRILFRTVDTPWMPGIIADLITWSLVLALLAAIAQTGSLTSAQGATRRESMALLAIGPLFALYHLVTGNLGLAESHLNLDFAGASLVLAFGIALGILGAAVRSSGEIAVLTDARTCLAWRSGLIVATAGGLLWFWKHPSSGSIGLVVGTAASIILFAELMLDSPNPRSTDGSAWLAVAFTAGLLVQVGLLFGYYTYSGNPAFLTATTGVLLAIAAATTPSIASGTRERRFPVVTVAGVAGALLLLTAGWEVWSWDDAAATSAIGPNLTVMTYNIQTGFSSTERFDLAQIADTIASQHPDIVVLQEVSRGWLVTSGVDEVLWLSQRLHMNYTFGANSDDGMWGNVVLSRAPIGSVKKVQYNITENLKRSVLQVQIATQTGDLWVLATHLDDPPDAGAVRLEQAHELLAAWNHDAPTLLMGDMNSDPTDPVIKTFEAAGLVNFDQTMPNSVYTSKDGRRIDYIFGTPDIRLVQIGVPEVWTSDHRPVVARVTLAR